MQAAFEVEVELLGLEAAESEARLARWRRNLMVSAYTDYREVYRWVKKRGTSETYMVKVGNDLVAGKQEAVEAVAEAWRPIFNRYETREKPQADAFVEAYSRYIPTSDFDPGDITPDKVLARSKRNNLNMSRI